MDRGVVFGIRRLDLSFGRSSHDSSSFIFLL